MTLGIFWVGQHRQLNHLQRADRDLTWLHSWFLATVALMPFSTRRLAEFIELRTALLVYCCNIKPAQLLRTGTAERIVTAIDRRIVSAQSWNALGAALCFTYCSITFIFLLQLNCALAPRFRPRHTRLGRAQRRTRRISQLAHAMRKLRSRCDRSLMGTLGVRQMHSAYSRMVRSEEKLPERAVFKMDIAVQLCPS